MLFRSDVLLRLLVSSKPFATVLELGTGTGMGLAWLAEGLHPEGNLVTVEKDKKITPSGSFIFRRRRPYRIYKSRCI